MKFFNRKQKVFCIGRNKTGTTTIEAVLKSLGYRLGDQMTAEMLYKDWTVRDFRMIIKFCKSADAFQDAPFSNDFTFQALDSAYPNSKFILTIRNDKDEWYQSLTRFHTKLIGKGRLPTKDDLKEYHYRFKGFLWESQKMIYGIDEKTLYDYDIYTSQYENHNNAVEKYFMHRPDDLLVISVAENDAIKKLYDFLGHTYRGAKMPHLNTSK